MQLTMLCSRSLRRTGGGLRFASATASDKDAKSPLSSLIQGGDRWQALRPDALWILNGAGDTTTSLAEKAATLARSAPQEVASAMLPHGYPVSVKDGYDKYILGQMAGAVFGSASGVFSMQALLYAVGLGQGAIPMAAALNWVIKDGLGQLGGVLAVHMINTKFDSGIVSNVYRVPSLCGYNHDCVCERF